MTATFTYTLILAAIFIGKKLMLQFAHQPLYFLGKKVRNERLR